MLRWILSRRRRRTRSMGFISLYNAAYMSHLALFSRASAGHPALNVDSHRRDQDGHRSAWRLSPGPAHCWAMVGNPFFWPGLIDRTSFPRLCMGGMDYQRAVGGSLGILSVALAPSIPGLPRRMVLAQLCLQRAAPRLCGGNADQVPSFSAAWSPVSWGSARPFGSVCGTFGSSCFHRQPLLAMFLGRWRGRRICYPPVRGQPERSPAAKAEKAGRVAAGIPSTFRQSSEDPDFAWAFASRFMFVLAFTRFLSPPAYYLLEQDRHRQGRRAAADISRHARPFAVRRRRFPHRREGLGP